MFRYLLNQNLEQVTEVREGEHYYSVLYAPSMEYISIDKKDFEGNMLNTTEEEREKIKDFFTSLNEADFKYLTGLKEVLENGTKKSDRTGVGTISQFGGQIRYDLSKGFPLLTTKKMNIKNIVSELIWFINGDTNIKYLLQHNNPIWTDWAFEKFVKSKDYSWDLDPSANINFADPEIYRKEIKEFEKRILEDEDFAKIYGELGPVYGKQWRDFNGVDQVRNIISQIKNSPNSRRIILSAWNVSDLEKMALPPCHCLLQFYVNDNKLSCQLYQRSMDKPLGEPYNIASYSILVHLVALECGLEVGEFIHTSGDSHIYQDQISGVQEQLSRLPKKAPKLQIDNFTSIFNLDPNDIYVTEYEHHPFIKFPIAK